MRYLDSVGLRTAWTDMHPHVCFYGTCSTMGGVQAKVANVSGMLDLTAGTRVLVRFAQANTQAVPTLQVRSANLAQSSDLAYPIIDEDGNTLSAAVAGVLHGLCEFIYDGDGHWVLLSNKATNQIVYTETSEEPLGEPGMIWLKKKS